MKRTAYILARLVLILFINQIFCHNLIGQITNEKKDSFPYLAKPDSIIKTESYGKVYITTDTTSKPYEWIVPNPNKKYLINYYVDYINDIKGNFEIDLTIFDINDFPRKWNSVYVFNDKFYIYGPSDWMFNTGYYISDSVVYIAESDPGDLYVILDFKQPDLKNGEFQTINHLGNKLSIKILPIDSDYGIYIWTFTNDRNEIVKRRIMQDSRFVKRLPMILSDCGENKCHMEFKFDEPDYNKLINK